MPSIPHDVLSEEALASARQAIESSLQRTSDPVRQYLTALYELVLVTEDGKAPTLADVQNKLADGVAAVIRHGHPSIPSKELDLASERTSKAVLNALRAATPGLGGGRFLH